MHRQHAAKKTHGLTTPITIITKGLYLKRWRDQFNLRRLYQGQKQDRKGQNHARQSGVYVITL